MKSQVLGLALVLTACAHGSGGSAEVESAQVYVAKTGLKVELLTMKTGDRCLVRVRKSAAENFDDHVFGCARVVEGNRVRHRIERDGRTWSVLDFYERGVRVWVPSQRDEVHVTLDEAASKALDVGEMLASHDKETKNGTLAKLAAFDRPKSEKSNQDDFNERVEQVKQACGVEVKSQLELNKVSDAHLQKWAIGSICGDVLSGIADLCESPAAKAFFRDEVTAFSCTSMNDDTKPSVMALDGKTLRYTVGDASNVRENARSFFGLVGASELSKGNTIPWGDGSSLNDKLVLTSMNVCADDKGRVIAFDRRRIEMREDRFREAMYTGTSKELFAVQNPGRYAGYFLEPRHTRKTGEGDARFYSSVKFDRDAKQCTVLCGEREVRVPMLSTEDGVKLVQAAKFGEGPFSRKPHALLRDRVGNYYYVDTSTLPNREKDFHVYVGQRGRMKRQQLTNALSDTAGDLFTTKTGELRLSLDSEKGSFWHDKAAQRALRVVPVNENLDVIFTELGVYSGRLGNPCDDF